MPWRKLGAGAVPAGYELSCEQACRATVDADSEVTLRPGSVVSVGSYFQVPLFARDKLVPAHEVELRSGMIDAVSHATRGLPLVISSLGSSHVALRDAEAQVILKDDHVATQVTRGTARIGANRKWMMLESGQTSILRVQGGPSEPAPGLVAPEWTAGPDCRPALALTGGAAPSVLGGCWKPVVRADSYVVELSREPSFSTIDTIEESKTPSWSKALSDGKYFMRVHAVDEDGLVGANSASRKLGTIAVKAPPGSTVDVGAHTFTLPQGRSLEFVEPDGLETALDSRGFLPAQRFLVMDDVPSHVLRVRFKDDPGSVGTAVLQRRALAADVAFSPRLARWPQDPIDITVTLGDVSGVVDPSQVSPKIHVLVGLAEVPVDWTHKGRVWSARLAPRNVAPTVVRVIAEDEFGTPIGRKFIEVDQGHAGPGYVANK